MKRSPDRVLPLLAHDLQQPERAIARLELGLAAPSLVIVAAHADHQAAGVEALVAHPLGGFFQQPAGNRPGSLRGSELRREGVGMPYLAPLRRRQGYAVAAYLVPPSFAVDALKNGPHFRQGEAVHFRRGRHSGAVKPALHAVRYARPVGQFQGA